MNDDDEYASHAWGILFKGLGVGILLICLLALAG